MNPVDEDRALDGEYDAPSTARGREAMDPTTRKMVWLASFIAVLLAVVIGGWALGGRHSGAIPIVEALPGPVRFKPVDPGGMVAPDEQPSQETSPGLDQAALDQGGQNPEGREMLAPPPEAAKPDALRAEVDAARRRDAKPAAAAPAPTAPPGSPPAASAQPPASSQPAAAAQQGASPPNASPAVMIPVPRQPPPVPSGDLFHTEAAPSDGLSGGARAVQLAALNSDEAAMSEWGRLRASHPALFSGRSPLIEQADHDGHAIYRLRTRGFASTEAAASFCEHARAERVACTVADF